MKPASKDQIIAYYDDYLEYLKEDHVISNKRHRHIRVKLSSLIRRGAKILDLGCGTGLTSHWIAQCGGIVTAVDISPKLIAFARKKSAHKNIKYIISDITELNLRKKFDGIVMVDVFEHIPKGNIDKLMEAIKKHSHENTWIFLNLPDERYQCMAYVHIKDKLQIVDEGYSISVILGKFRAIGFEAAKIDIYGLDIICQYNSFLFTPKKKLMNAYETGMKGK